MRLAREKGVPHELVAAVKEVNDRRRTQFVIEQFRGYGRTDEKVQGVFVHRGKGGIPCNVHTRRLHPGPGLAEVELR